MNKIVLYCHSGSYNHGCEAIVRSTAKLFSNQKILLSSKNKVEDDKYAIDKICQVKQCGVIEKKNLYYYYTRIFVKLFNSKRMYRKLETKNFINSICPDNLYFSIGGDNYCYKEIIDDCIFFNKQINKKGAKTVLWGVSIEPEIIAKKRVQKDLNKYALIVARESITYQALLDAGINKTILCPDPAFVLDKVELPWPDGFQREKGVVGINISPMALDYSGNSIIILQNYKKLIDYILDNTDYSIALIPHVIWNGGDDRVVNGQLYENYHGNDRVVCIDDHNCEELKGYIARCRFFVGARTHSTIAAYSSLVPTLVVGYSVKAKGIAQDLFGEYEHYVIPVQNIDNENELTDHFMWITQHEDEIKNQLKEVQKRFSEEYIIAKEAVAALL